MRAKRAPVPTETEEHRTIAMYFKKIGLGGGALAIHIRNENGSAWERMIATKAGILPGMTDWLILCKKTAPVCIEIKPRGWKARKARTGKYNAHEERQLKAHDRLREAGCWVEICETLNDVIATLAKHGVPIRKESITTERITRGFINALSEPIHE